LVIFTAYPSTPQKRKNDSLKTALGQKAVSPD
jgi:hypothetical protein